MKRDIKMTIEVPADMEEDFRLFIVLHGGAIVDCEKDNNDKHESK